MAEINETRNKKTNQLVNYIVDDLKDTLNEPYYIKQDIHTMGEMYSALDWNVKCMYDYIREIDREHKIMIVSDYENEVVDDDIIPLKDINKEIKKRLIKEKVF